MPISLSAKDFCVIVPEEFRKMRKLGRNVRINGHKVYSYQTWVATIERDRLVYHGYWSPTTCKHLNTAARILGIPLCLGERFTLTGISKSNYLPRRERAQRRWNLVRRRKSYWDNVNKKREENAMDRISGND